MKRASGATSRGTVTALQRTVNLDGHSVRHAARSCLKSVFFVEEVFALVVGMNPRRDVVETVRKHDGLAVELLSQRGWAEDFWEFGLPADLSPYSCVRHPVLCRRKADPWRPAENYGGDTAAKARIQIVRSRSAYAQADS